MSGNEQLRKEKLIIDDERETAEKVEHRRQRKKKIDERHQQTSGSLYRPM